MSAYLYDTALVKKFNKWTEKTNVHVYGPDESRQLFEVIADTTDDSPITLPIISIVRLGGYEIMNQNKRPLSYDGRHVTSFISGEKKTILQLNAIPIQLSYQINVYTRYYKEADAYMRELIFNLINYPKLEITIPYHDANIIQQCSIDIATSVEDNSSIPERLSIGQFTRLSLSIMIQDAYIWDTRLKTVLSMDGELLIQSSDTDVIGEDLDLAFENKTT